MVPEPVREMGWSALVLCAFVFGVIVATFFLACGGFARMSGIGGAEGGAAIVTTCAFIYTWSAQRKVERKAVDDRADRAAYTALVLRQELVTLYDAGKLMVALARAGRKANDDRRAILDATSWVSDLPTHMLHAFADKLDVFAAEDAAAVMYAISVAGRWQRTRRPPDAEIQALHPVETAKVLAKIVAGALELRRASGRAYVALKPYMGRILDDRGELKTRNGNAA
jgi:hypothetical protein